MYRALERKEVEGYYSKYYPKLMQRWESKERDPRPMLLRRLGVCGLKDKRILDVGCGTGKAMEDAGILRRNKVWGIDISRPFLAMARRRGIIAKHLDIDKKGGLPYPKGSFDCIFILDVIEHVFYPKSMIRKCGRVLKRGGILVFTLPKKDALRERWSYRARMEEKLENVYEGRIPDKARRYPDFNFVPIAELRGVLSSEGLIIKSIHGFNWEWNSLSVKEREIIWNSPAKGRTLIIMAEKK